MSVNLSRHVINNNFKNNNEVLYFYTVLDAKLVIKIYYKTKIQTKIMHLFIINSTTRT